MATTSHFYVTPFCNASREIYKQNTHADCTDKKAQLVDLVSTSNWGMGLCEISCSSQPMEEETLVPIYCKLISPQFLGDSPSAACGPRSSHHHQQLVSMSFETCTTCVPIS